MSRDVTKVLREFPLSVSKVGTYLHTIGGFTPIAWNLIADHTVYCKFRRFAHKLYNIWCAQPGWSETRIYWRTTHAQIRIDRKFRFPFLASRRTARSNGSRVWPRRITSGSMRKDRSNHNNEVVVPTNDTSVTPLSEVLIRGIVLRRNERRSDSATQSNVSPQHCSTVSAVWTIIRITTAASQGEEHDSELPTTMCCSSISTAAAVWVSGAKKHANTMSKGPKDESLVAAVAVTALRPANCEADDDIWRMISEYVPS